MMKKRIKVSFTQQSKVTVADTTVEYWVEGDDKVLEKLINKEILDEAVSLQNDAQLRAVGLSMHR